jgi:hypothetical protein
VYNFLLPCVYVTLMPFEELYGLHDVQLLHVVCVTMALYYLLLSTWMHNTYSFCQKLFKRNDWNVS